MCDVKVNGQKSLVDSILMVLAQDALVPPPKARLVRIWTFVNFWTMRLPISHGQ